MKTHSYMDISQNVPRKSSLTRTNKPLPRPVMQSVQSLDADGKIQKKDIYNSRDLSTRICRAYYRFCIGKLDRSSRKLLLHNGILHYSDPGLDEHKLLQ